MLFGYTRVSTQEQETHAQTDALREAGVGFVFFREAFRRRRIEEASPRTDARNDSIRRYRRRLQAGPRRAIVERPADQHQRIEAAGAQFRSLTEHIDTRAPAGRMNFQIVGAFAEFERELIRERTKLGMAAAARRGVKMGRPTAMSTEDEEECLKLWFTGNYTKSALARRYSTHISSIKRAIRRHNERTQPSLLNAA